MPSLKLHLPQPTGCSRFVIASVVNIIQRVGNPTPNKHSISKRTYRLTFDIRTRSCTGSSSIPHIFASILSIFDAVQRHQTDRTMLRKTLANASITSELGVRGRCCAAGVFQSTQKIHICWYTTGVLKLQRQNQRRYSRGRGRIPRYMTAAVVIIHLRGT